MARAALYIGEIARRSGTTVKAVRHYERLGLLHPAGRSSGGFRVYNEAALERLGFIRSAQRLGFSLAEIGEVLSVYDDGAPACGRVVDVIDEKLRVVEARMAELEQLRDALSDARERLPAGPATQPRGICPVVQAG